MNISVARVCNTHVFKTLSRHRGMTLVTQATCNYYQLVYGHCYPSNIAYMYVHNKIYKFFVIVYSFYWFCIHLSSIFLNNWVPTNQYTKNRIIHFDVFYVILNRSCPHLIMSLLSFNGLTNAHTTCFLKTKWSF